MSSLQHADPSDRCRFPCSSATHERAQSAPIVIVPDDEALVAQSDYILSIVPPRDALATARRVVSAAKSQTTEEGRHPLYYLDLNAISPRSARQISQVLEASPRDVRFLDGGMIGAPPKPSSAASTTATPSQWTRPSIVLSGPHPLHEAPTSGADLASVLNTEHLGAQIGTASGLKCCFASLTKGLTALAIQSFGTASRLGVLPQLQSHLRAFSPKTGELVARSLVGMPPKAYRWVAEMRQVGETFAEEGGWALRASVFEHVAEVYRVVAEETVLGREKNGERWRGLTVEDVAEAVSEGLGGKQR